MSETANGTEFYEYFQSDLNNGTIYTLTTHPNSYNNYSDSVDNTTINNSIAIKDNENITVDYILDGDQNWNSSTSMDFSATATTTAAYSVINGTITAEQIITERQIIQFWIGVGLSISSSVFIGLSFIIKKKALIRLSKGGKRANQGGYGYLKDMLWWSGLLSMAVGEAANFMAYTFAPASLVSTLGVLSVLVTAILSSRYLHERLNFLGKIGCFLCAIGSTVIVIHAPMEKEIESMDDLEEKLTNFVFVIYVLLTIVLSLILIYHYRPKVPETSTYTLLIWIGVCSMIGSLSVMSVKGLGLALMQTISGIENGLGNWLTWFCFITLVVCVSVQMNFLNKALDTFNTAVVTPIYYVFFTSCVIIASAILFHEFANVPLKDWVGLICGFSTVLTAIALLHLCKNFDLTLFKLTQQLDLVNSHSSCGSDLVAGGNPELPGKHQVDPLAFPVPASTSAYAISVRENDLKQPSGGGNVYDNNGSTNQDSDSDDDLFRSVESSHSTKKSGSGSPLTPDSRLLSGSYANGRGRDGYIPISYGTTDNCE